MYKNNEFLFRKTIREFHRQYFFSFLFHTILFLFLSIFYYSDLNEELIEYEWIII